MKTDADGKRNWVGYNVYEEQKNPLPHLNKKYGEYNFGSNNSEIIENMSIIIGEEEKYKSYLEERIKLLERFNDNIVNKDIDERERKFNFEIIDYELLANEMHIRNYYHSPLKFDCMPYWVPDSTTKTR